MWQESIDPCDQYSPTFHKNISSLITFWKLHHNYMDISGHSNCFACQLIVQFHSIIEADNETYFLMGGNFFVVPSSIERYNITRLAIHRELLTFYYVADLNIKCSGSDVISVSHMKLSGLENFETDFTRPWKIEFKMPEKMTRMPANHFHLDYGSKIEILITRESLENRQGRCRLEIEIAQQSSRTIFTSVDRFKQFSTLMKAQHYRIGVGSDGPLSWQDAARDCQQRGSMTLPYYADHSFEKVLTSKFSHLRHQNIQRLSQGRSYISFPMIFHFGLHRIITDQQPVV